MAEYALIVEKARTGDVIESLRTVDEYDEERRVREHDGETNEVPVTTPAPTVEDNPVIVQQEPEYRLRSLADRLRAQGWTDDELDAVPSSWGVVGDIVLVQFPDDCPRPAEVAEVLLELQGAETVLARHGISGELREPSVEVVAGTGDTETIHTEHGTKYALDLAEVMFSPGNKAERVQMGDDVTQGERVLDMFAGIGYFTLPMARSGAAVTAIERNPTAFRYLIENVALNEVTDRVTPYRADCRDVVEWHADPDTTVDIQADRIVMGYYDAHEYLDAALDVLEPDGVLHFHAATPDAELWARPVERVETAAKAADRSISVLDKRRVKTFAEGVYHVVLEVQVA